MNPAAPDLTPTRVWDLPTRVFHWVLALTLIGSVVTAKIGGNAMVWHVRLGLLVMALLLFRLVWGFVGGRWSRFVAFLYTPRHLMAYLRGDPVPQAHFDVGHSPLGALSVFALLALLVAQVATGLVADDEIATTGPLNRFVETALGLQATSWHKGPGQYLILGLAALHIGAVLYYRIARGTDLIVPMWRGDKALAPGTPASADGAAQRAWAAVLMALALGLAAWVASLGA
jgi:cytochrome b